MATRNPADTSLPNYKCVDWYEPHYGKTCQSEGGIPVPTFLTSDVIYGHDKWDAETGQVIEVDPIQVEYPA